MRLSQSTLILHERGVSNWKSDHQMLGHKPYRTVNRPTEPTFVQKVLTLSLRDWCGESFPSRSWELTISAPWFKVTWQCGIKFNTKPRAREQWEERAKRTTRATRAVECRWVRERMSKWAEVPLAIYSFYFWAVLELYIRAVSGVF